MMGFVSLVTRKDLLRGVHYTLDVLIGNGAVCQHLNCRSDCRP